MDPLTLVTTVVGLLGTCMTLLDKCAAFKDAGTSSSSVHSAFSINKLLLERWGRSVGIKGDALLPRHHELLDNPAVVRQVSQILTDIEDLCTKLDKSLKATSQNRDEPKPLRRVPTGSLATGASRTKSRPEKDGPSVLAKLDWVGRSHAKSKAHLEELRNKLGDLFKLVPLPDAQLERHLLEWHARIEAETRAEVRKWLAAPWNTDVYDRSCRSRLPSTCEWIFKRDFFLDWMSPDFPDTKPKVLWVNGPAGYGKTILCAKSWLFQLVSQSSAALNVARELWDPNMSPSASQEDVLRVLNSVLRDCGGCTLVADGLDECAWAQDSRAGDQDRNSTMGFFRSLAEVVSQTKTRVLLFSRMEEDRIKPAFNAQLSSSQLISTAEHSIVPDDVHLDAKVFSQDIARKKLGKRSEEQQAELADKMLAKSDGMFLWMKMLEGDLAKANNTKKVFRAVEQAPIGIQHLYVRNWDRIANNPDSDAKARAFTILRWAAFSARPLTVLELVEALTILEDGDADDLDDDELPDEMSDIDEDYVQTNIVDLCGSLVEVRRQKQGGTASSTDTPSDHNSATKDDAGPDEHQERGEIPPAACDTINIVHPSVREFLIGRLPFDAGLRPVDEMLANSDIAHTRHLTILCLRYLGVRRVWVEGLALGNETHERRFLSVALGAFEALSRHADDISITPTIARMVCKLIDPRFKTWSLLEEHIESWAWQDEAQEQNCRVLFLACWFGVEPVRYVLSEVKIPATTSDSAGNTALHQIFYGKSPSKTMVKLLIEYGADVNALNNDGVSALSIATKQGQLAGAKALLEHGAKQDPDSSGVTPLHLAARRRHMGLVQLFLAQGADVNAKSRSLQTPLHSACSKGSEKVAALLLDRGAEAGVKDEAGETPLSYAIAGGSKIWKRLFDETSEGQDFDINATYKIGCTLLHLVADRGGASATATAEATGLFLDRGANIEARHEESETPLHVAARSGNEHCLTALLSRGADTEAKNKIGLTTLHVAVCNGQAAIAELLLGRGADIESRDEDGMTPIHNATQFGMLDCIKVLQAHGADLACREDHKDGWTALHYAANFGHLDSLKYLLEHGIDPCSEDALGVPPIHYACREGKLECIGHFLDLGMDPNYKDIDGQSPAHWASESGHTSCLELLLGRGADPDSSDRRDWSPTHCAARNGHKNCLNLLLDRGANIRAATVDGWMPIHFASWNGRTDCLEPLLDRGADPHAIDLEGNAPIHLAAENGHTDCLKLLLDRGADLHVTDGYGSAPVHIAASHGRLDFLELLLDRGADLHAPDDDGSAPVHFATEKGRLDCLKLLLDRGADIDATNTDGSAPIHIAALNGHLDCLELLLERGAAMDVQDSDGWSLAYYAAECEQPECLQFLLHKGVGFRSETNDGLTPLHSAVGKSAEAGYLDCVKFLLEAGADVRATSKFSHWTPAHVAARSTASPDSLDLLLKAAPDSAHPDAFGRTILHWAARSASEETLNVALAHGSPDALGRDRYGLSSLSLAVAGGHEGLAARLLTTIEGQFDFKDNFGRSLLWWARRSGSTELEELLRREVEARGAGIIEPAAHLDETNLNPRPGSPVLLLKSEKFQADRTGHGEGRHDTPLICTGL
ncbi:hypothetical protein RB595_007664 [Gaeumannomyces hyphopodioides]